MQPELDRPTFKVCKLLVAAIRMDFKIKLGTDLSREDGWGILLRNYPILYQNQFDKDSGPASTYDLTI